jgi:hypothetical protein
MERKWVEICRQKGTKVSRKEQKADKEETVGLTILS